MQPLNSTLSTLPYLIEGESRSLNAENPNGEKAAGGRASGPLGVGRKGRAFISLEPGETATLADIRGAGMIQHIWMTVTDQTESGPYVLRDLVLRMYWDGEQTPSVEVPLGDFFCNGFGARALVNSLPITVVPRGGMNSYFPMPFADGARIEVTSEHPQTIRAFFFQIDFLKLDALPPGTGTFHAQWRRSRTTNLREDYVILDGVRGDGQYVGTYLGVAALERYWWGEGEFKFFLDGDNEWPTICGTGIEDYFGGAWAFQDRDGHTGEVRVHTFSTPYLGYPFYSREDETRGNPYSRDALPMHGMYRWHVLDPIRFRQDLKVTVQQIGHQGSSLFERSDDVCSVAYWYQREPHAAFPSFLPAPERRPR